VKKAIKISLISLAVIILLPLVFVTIVSVFYTDEVKQMLLGEINKSIRTQVQVKKIDISLISMFPDASLVFSDVVVFSPEDFRDADFPKMNTDTLLKAEAVYLRFNIFDILKKKYTIKAIEIHDGTALILNDKKGNGNYEFWKEDSTGTDSPVSIRLQAVTLKRTDMRYRNAAKDLKIDCSTEKLKVSGSFYDESYSVSTSGGLSLTRLSAGNMNYLVKPAYITAEFDFNESGYTITSGRIKTGDLSIGLSGNFTVDPVFNCNISLNGKDMDITTVISLLPEQARKRMDGFSSSGKFYFSGSIEGEVDHVKSPRIDLQFGVENATVKHRSGINISQLYCKGWYSNGTSQTLATSFLRLDSIQARTGISEFTGSYLIDNFESPMVELIIKGRFDLGEIRQLTGSDSIAEMKGMAEADIRFSGKMKSPGQFTKDDYRNGKTQGIISLIDVDVKETGTDVSYTGINGRFNFRQNDLEIDSLSLTYRDHNFRLRGSFRNLAGYLLNDENMIVEGLLKCGDFDFGKFYGKSSAGETGFAIPGKMKLKAQVHLGSFTYDSFKANDIRGFVEIENNTLTGRKVSFSSCGGNTYADGVLTILSNGNLQADIEARFENILINELFRQFDNFGQDYITDKHLAGRLKAELNMKAEWDSKMSLIEEKLLVSSHLVVEKGELIKFEPMMELSKFIAVSELMHIKSDKLESDITIKKRIIFIPNTEIKSSAFNIELSGEHSFDNHINYRLKILLSEILAGKARQQKKDISEFGEIEPDGLHRTRLFILISGTTDDFKISYDTQGVKESIKESLKNEKETVKELLKEEFGNIFKKDTTGNIRQNPKEKQKEKDKSNQGVTIEW
jgi:hypothetical protein